MKKVKIRLQLPIDEKKILAQFRRTIRAEALTLKSEGTLKTIPGSVHWHITKPNKSGTLEATLDNKQSRLWLCYHDNRYADWIDNAIDRIKTKLEPK
jgi:hypothetical protein